jgi:dolichyl-phosphate beta-glucosyltransferase
MIRSLTIIFPVYNEEKRINSTFIDIKKFNKKKIFKSLEYIFVDDGSKDRTVYNLKKFIDNNKSNSITYKIVSIPSNNGKGFAIKKGISLAKKNWILTIDADISVSLIEINNWIKKKYLDKKVFIYFGSRNLIDSIVNYKIHRKLLGYIFFIILKILFNIELKDTQCGFKLYRKDIAKKIFTNVYDKGFVHDVEVVLISKKLNLLIKELPVKWTHKKDSKLNLIMDSFKMLLKLLSIKIHTQSM